MISFSSMRRHKFVRSCAFSWLSMRPEALTIRIVWNMRSLVTSAQEQIKKDAKPISEMPGVKSLPLVGSLPFIAMHKDFSPNTMNHFWISLNEKYGSIYRVTFPTMPPLVVMTNPDDIEIMYKLTGKNPVRKGFTSVEQIRREAADDFFENKVGIIAENGDEWWRVRSRVQTPMMKPANIVKYLPKVDEVTLDFIERIAEFQSHNGEMPETFIDELYKWALENLGLIAFNRRLQCFNPNLSEDSDQVLLIKSVSTIFESLLETELSLPIWKLIPTKKYKRLRNAHEIFLNVVFKYIKVAEEEMVQKIKSGLRPEDFTLLEVLLHTDGLTRKDVMTVMLDMFFAGIDTTTHTIGFTLYLLARNPKAQERLHQELDEVLGDGKQGLTDKHMARLSYTKACVKESMRIFPLVSGAVRELQEDAVIRGYHIPKGHQLFGLQLATTQDEKNFARAKEFLPERWDRDRPLGRSHPFAHLPFSHGTRMCIGRRIAEQEMYTFIARVMHRYKVDYKYEGIESVTKLVSIPSQPLRFEFLERK